jgi:Asp-tRNA(Asn)/Glu-tRNA(Gln) amidotransferase A subunit family amidase
LNGADTGNAVITAVEAPAEARHAGALSGRRVLVKDLIDVAGVRTTYGSKIYADHVPARNPLHPGRTTGGSSSGNGAALAARLCDLGLATDTGCSIRLPSACCATVGLKPRWGQIPMDGIYPLCPTLDTVGPMARSVEDVALMWSVLTAEPVPEARLVGLTVGLLTRPPSLGDGLVPGESLLAEQWAADLERLGARVMAATVPDPAADTWPLFFHEAARSHRDTFPSRADQYGDNCRIKLEIAQTVDPGGVAAAWVNLIGWAGLAIGNLQLIAPRDETVLAAGLAWERDRHRGEHR